MSGKIIIHSFICIFLLLFIVGSVPSLFADVRIMNYNLKNFWLSFDGEPEIYFEEGASLSFKDLTRIADASFVINRFNPDVVGILESAGLAELIFLNERFLGNRYRCFSFRATDSRTAGIPLGFLVRKDWKVESMELLEPRTFSSRGVLKARISRGDDEITFFLVHFKSQVEDNAGDSARKRDAQGRRLLELVREELSQNPDAELVIFGDFNDVPGLSKQEKAAGVPDLIELLQRDFEVNGTKTRLYNVTLLHPDRDTSGKLWSEKSTDYPPALLDYFLLSQKTYSRFKRVDHIYPEEFSYVLEASDHLPCILDLK
jgi:endonuclease/exonuclease/phosphatase family metal-dependent hydrolase